MGSADEWGEEREGFGTLGIKHEVVAKDKKEQVPQMKRLIALLPTLVLITITASAQDYKEAGRMVALASRFQGFQSSR